MVEWLALVSFKGIAFTILVSSGALISGIVSLWHGLPTSLRM